MGDVTSQAALGQGTDGADGPLPGFWTGPRTDQPNAQSMTGNPMTVGTRSALQRYTPSSTLQCKRTLRPTAKSAAQPQEAAGEDAAFEEVVELVLHELRQVGAGGSLDVREEGLGMLLPRLNDVGPGSGSCPGREPDRWAGQRAVEADRRARAAPPTRAKPSASIAKVVGSGTLVARSTPLRCTRQ